MSEKEKINLDFFNIQELTELIAAAEGKRAEKIVEARAAILAEFEAKAAEIGLNIRELCADPEKSSAKIRQPRKDIGVPVAAKYRGPNGEEWSGRGRRPSWLVKAEAEGKDKEHFRIDL